MRAANTVFKGLAKRHHLALTNNVPVDESTISFESILSHGGSTDKYLAHGAVGHTEVSVSLRILSIKQNPRAKASKVNVFAVAVPRDNSHYMLIVSSKSLPPAMMEIIRHSQNKEHKGLLDSQHHQLYMKHIPHPEEQAYGRRLAAKLPQAVNLEQTSRQLVLFTAEMPDSGQAEHLLRRAIELS